MRVAIRVDASVEIGTGHLRRCLTLARELTRFDAKVWLVCRPLDGVASSVLRGVEIPVLWLPAADPSEVAVFDHSATEPQHAAWARVAWSRDARETVDVLRDILPDWVVVDHYAFDASWHETISRCLHCRLAVIDDLADRPIAADFLLDHNWASDHKAKYANCVVGGSLNRMRMLGGPRYALLGSNYRAAPRYSFHPEVRSIGIFMGGTDPGAVSLQILAVCRQQIGFEGRIEVVLSSANPHLSSLREACDQSPNTTLTLDLPDLAAFFARHDLQIGAGGGATWERCCIGVPSIVLMIAQNQFVVVSELARLGVLCPARVEMRSPVPADDTTKAEPVAGVLRGLLINADLRRRLGATAMTLVDGLGAQRVALCLLGDRVRLRKATVSDAHMLHNWRNHPSVRAVSTQTAEIAYENHMQWLLGALGDPGRVVLIGEIGHRALGCIRFDNHESPVTRVSLYIDPVLHGLGLGLQLLLAGEQFMAGCAKDIITIIAEVVPGNNASERLFTASGYTGGPLRYEKSVKPAPASNYESKT